MEKAEATAQVRQLAGELRNWQRMAERAAVNTAALNKILIGYIEMFPDLEPLVQEVTNLEPEADAGPKGAAAVRTILQEDPNEWWLVSDLVSALRRRDWLPDSENPANAVRAALERLVNNPDSDIHRDKSGNSVVYAYLPDKAPDAPASARPIANDAPTYDEEPF